jgi:nucleoid-associated protein YgaU
MSRPAIQRDLSTVLERAGMPILTAQVQNILSNGQVTETTLAPGTVIEWMALRRGGPNVVRNIRWDGAAPLEGFEFIIDDMNETYTFFVPEICGNVSLVRREPSREAARRAEAAKAAAAAEAAKAAAAKAAADKAAADKAAADKAAADKAAADKAAADKAAADKAAADKAAADAAAAEAARLAEEARLALERDLRTRPFFAVFGGKQQRQYDDNDPADVGQLVNPVPAFGDPLVGFKGGVNLKMSQHWTFAPAVGFAFNLDEGSRSTLFGDAELNYIFARGAYLGTGVTLWDVTHGSNFTLGWLGTAGVPVWRNDMSYRQLLLSAEWRQMFDRMSDPDVNYQFWGGLKFLFK